MELRRRLINTLIMLAVMVLVATCGYKFFGRNVTWVNALYMTIVTLTTVGYGEIVDTSHSVGLRLFNVLVLMFGIGLMAYVFSISTAFVVEGELKNIFWRRKMQRRIGNFQGHFVVCGGGDIGVPVVTELVKTGRQVVVIDTNFDRLRKFETIEHVAFLEGDATDEEILEQAGLSHAAGVVAALPSDKDNLVVTVIIRQKYPNLRIVSRSAELKMADKIRLAGADSVVSPMLIGGMRLASEMVRPHVVTFLDLMLKEQSKTLRIEEISVPYHSAWVGQQLGKIALREKFDVCCLAVKHRAADAYLYNPHDSEVVQGNSVLVVMGDVERIIKARHAAEAAQAMAR